MATIFPNDVPSKANPVDADILLVADSADNNELKQITIGSITADIGDGLIVDSSASSTTTYSSDKINTLNGAQNTTISGNYTTLNNAKLNKNAQLRTGNGAWKTIYNDGSGNEVELALGASGYVLNSNGASAAPTWVAPSVNIIGQTEATDGDMDNDVALIYEASAGANRKQKINTYRATDAEALAGTVTNKFVTPAQVISKTSTTIAYKTIDEASTTQTITHNLGRMPKRIEIHGLSDGNGASHGFCDVGNGQQGCAFRAVTTGYGSYQNGSAVMAMWNSQYTAGNIGNVGNITSTTFDISWTKVGNPGGANLYMVISVF